MRQNCYYCCCYFHPSCSLSSGYNIDTSIKLPLVNCIEKQLYCLLVTLFTHLCLSLLNFPHNRIWLGSWRVLWLRKYTKSCKNFRLTPATPAFCAGQQRRNDDTHSFLNCLLFLSLKTCKELVNFHNELIKSCCYCPCCYYCAHAFYPTKFRKNKTTKKAGERHICSDWKRERVEKQSSEVTNDRRKQRFSRFASFRFSSRVVVMVLVCGATA